MSSVTIVIDALGDNHVVSNWAYDLDIWMNKKTNIGVCEFVLDNTGDVWGDDFEPNDTIAISINGVLMFTGFVDNVTPLLEKTGVLTNKITVRGRDSGRYLTDYYYTEDFSSTRAGAVIDDILAGVGDPLLYTDPGGTPFIKYNSQRGKLVDSFKDISDLSGYDFYIDTTGRVQFFDAGTVASGVALKTVAAAADNNILSLEESEEIGYDIKNYIELHGGSLKDHWTEGNSADWTDLLGGATAFADETTVTIYGASSIKVTAADGDETFGLDFSAGKYSQGTSIDMSQFAQNKVLFRHDDASTGDYTLRPYLKDGSGNEVLFTRNKSGEGSKGYTENISSTVDQWKTMSYPTGKHTDNAVVAIQTSGRWFGDTAFDWDDVEDIGFQLITTVGMSIIYIEGWYMPAIEVKSIDQNAASIAAYGTRMYSEFRKDLKSQIELDAESAKILAYKKDPLKKFKATASGQTGTKYAAQTATIQAPDYGLAGATTYVIQTLHHILHNDTNTRGWDYVTKYELALSDVDSTRVIADDNPLEAQMLKLARENRGFKGSVTDDEYYLGDIITGITPQITEGTAFPTDQNDGDLFYLSSDLPGGYYIGNYRYSEDAADWIRVGDRSLDGIEDGELYGHVLSSRRHEIYFNTQHVKYEGESLDGMYVLVDGAGSLIETPADIELTTGAVNNDDVIIASDGGIYTFSPSVDDHPVAFNTRVMWETASTNMDCYLMVSANTGAQDGAFGWLVNGGDSGNLARFYTKNGTWWTSRSFTPVRHIWYRLGAFYDPNNSRIVYQLGLASTYYKTVTGVDFDDINPCWMQITTTNGKAIKMHIQYWASTLDWTDIS